ncbi:MAG: sodium:alanine symporter family protein [Bacteroidota bacterium]
MEQIELILKEVDNAVWGWPMVFLLLGTHLYLTVRLKFLQRYMGKAIKISLGRLREGKGDVSQFGALTTAMAATIGTGNIIGVAIGVASGGPGAVFWMWITGVFGIATKYSESLLSVKYRVTTASGAMAGGPMYVLERGMKSRWLGLAFAGATAITAFGIGNLVQSNAIVTTLGETYGIEPIFTGVILGLLTAFVIIGGIRSIAKVCERLVPLMAFLYVGACLALLALNYTEIPGTIELIFTSAFSGHAVAGGFIGATVREAVRHGVSKGLFSNESGLGSAPIVAAAAQTKNPVRQALVSSSGTFWDTVVVCAITGITVVNSGAWLKGLSGPSLTQDAFTGLGVVGPTILAVALLTFAFSTILGWSYYGEKAAEYLFGSRAVRPYRWAWVVFVMFGSQLSVPVVWTFSNIANAFMALPNLLSLLVLSNVIVLETRKYLWEGKIDMAAEGDAESPPES